MQQKNYTQQKITRDKIHVINKTLKAVKKNKKKIYSKV